MIAFNELKAVAKVLQEAGKIEQYQQILDAQKELLEMQNKIVNLETDNKRLRDEFEIKENLISEGNLYWIIKDGKKDGPFCTCCWDSERKLVRLHKSEVSGRAHCPKCNTVARAGTARIYRSINHIKNPGR